MGVECGGSGPDANSSLLMAGSAWRARRLCLSECQELGKTTPAPAARGVQLVWEGKAR